jgi:uncharacterized membrane protein YgaE (UPF0421/DUF939 family)
VPANEVTASKPKPRALERAWPILYALDMAVVALLTYWIALYALATVSGNTSNTIGALWAVVSAIFVFRETREESVAAGKSRFLATCLSVLLCLIYLAFFPSTPIGMAILIAIGTLLLLLFRRHAELTTAAVTTAVIVVIAMLDPHDGWRQPLLRFADTLIGILVGLACNYIAFLLFQRLELDAR